MRALGPGADPRFRLGCRLSAQVRDAHLLPAQPRDQIAPDVAPAEVTPLEQTHLPGVLLLFRWRLRWLFTHQRGLHLPAYYPPHSADPPWLLARGAPSQTCSRLRTGAAVTSLCGIQHSHLAVRQHPSFAGP
jgi:hypothetical protein